MAPHSAASCCTAPSERSAHGSGRRDANLERNGDIFPVFCAHSPSRLEHALKKINLPEPGNVVVSHGHSDCCGPGPPLGMSINNPACAKTAAAVLMDCCSCHTEKSHFFLVTFICYKKCGICLRSLGLFLTPFKRISLAACNCQPSTSHRNSRWALILNALTYLFNSIRGLLVWAENLK